MLQAEILYGLSPTGKGLTVVGDDAQSIYSFRAATVRNILDFPKHYAGTTVVTLEQNYRSTEPILGGDQRSDRPGHGAVRQEPLVAIAARGSGPCWSPARTRTTRPTTSSGRSSSTARRAIDLRRQAVLFRASHHSMLLEAELARRNIPFHKYGGLKFVETAHVKDLMAFLRLAENRRDVVAGTRLLPLLPGIGPAKARQFMRHAGRGRRRFRRLGRVEAARRRPAELWPELVELLAGLAAADRATCPARSTACGSSTPRCWRPTTTNPQPRLRDLEQLELIAARYRNRRRMLMEMALDPPNSTQDLAGPPVLGRRLPGAQHDPFGQGPGMGRGAT